MIKYRCDKSAKKKIQAERKAKELAQQWGSLTPDEIREIEKRKR